jgi:crossover junction endodeoxyribonuclease RuvC
MSKGFKVLGLDVSSKTGMVMAEFKEGDWGVTFGIECNVPVRPKNPPKSPKGHKEPPTHPMIRVGKFAERLLELVDTHGKPDLAVIEAYAFGKLQNKDGIILQVGIGTVLRYFLKQLDIPYVEISPTGLKKYVTGKGSGGKDVIMKEVFKRWGFDTDNDNIADAFALAMVGGSLKGLAPELPKLNKEALEPVTESDLYNTHRDIFCS